MSLCLFTRLHNIFSQDEDKYRFGKTKIFFRAGQVCSNCVYNLYMSTRLLCGYIQPLVTVGGIIHLLGGIHGEIAC